MAAPVMDESTPEVASPATDDAPTTASGHAVLLVVQVCFSTLPIAAKYYVLPFLPSAGLVVLRVIGASAILFGVVRSRGSKPIGSRSDLAKLAGLAALGVAANQLLFIEGLNHTTPVNAQLIGTTIPVFTMMFGVFLGAERLGWRRVVGIGMAAAGVILLVGPDRVRLAPDTTLGNAMITANALAYSLYLVLVRPILKREDSLTVMAWVFGFGAIIVAPFGLTALARTGSLSAVPLRAWGGLAFIIAVPTVGAYWLSAWSLARSSASVVAAYIYLQPFLTALIAVGLFGERLDSRAIPSGALIFAGVALATRRLRPAPSDRRSRQSPSSSSLPTFRNRS